MRVHARSESGGWRGGGGGREEKRERGVEEGRKEEGRGARALTKDSG